MWVKMIKKQAIENYHIMKQRYTAAIKSEVSRSKRCEIGSKEIFFLYINTLSQRYQKVKTHRALKIEYTKKDKKIQKVKNKR